MRVALRWASLATILALVVPVTAADYGYGKKEKPDTRDPKDKLRADGKVTGTLTAVDSTVKTLTVQVKWNAPVQDPEVKRTIEQLKKKYADTSDASAKRAIYAEIVSNMRKEYSYQEKKQNLDLQSAEDVKVRWKNPPPAFDDKGNPKKYTKKELDELRGSDRKLPGYQAEFADLRKDMTVEVHVPKANAKAAKGNNKDEPRATMIIIVATPPK